jgi:hypothetical protein
MQLLLSCVRGHRAFAFHRACAQCYQIGHRYATCTYVRKRTSAAQSHSDDLCGSRWVYPSERDVYKIADGFTHRNAMYIKLPMGLPIGTCDVYKIADGFTHRNVYAICERYIIKTFHHHIFHFIKNKKMFKNLQFLLFSLVVFAACTNSNAEHQVSNSDKDTTSIIIKNNAETVNIDTTNAVFTGDLNGDSEMDKIEIVEKKCGEGDENADFKDAFCRTVVIYLAKNGGFEQFASNSEIVECSQCGGAGIGDPFRGIVIKNGYFTIEQLFGACTKTYIYTTFKYDKTSNDFLLHKVGNESHDCHPDKNDNIVTTTTEQSKNDFGKITFSEYSGGAEFIE